MQRFEGVEDRPTFNVARLLDRAIVWPTLTASATPTYLPYLPNLAPMSGNNGSLFVTEACKGP
jgi:hypothetical protein